VFFLCAQDGRIVERSGLFNKLNLLRQVGATVMLSAQQP